MLHRAYYRFNSILRSIHADHWLFLLLFSFITSGQAMTATFDLQGHRGARGLLPENTLPAFERAIALGVSTLELDVGVSKDGVVVISHDRALNPEITRDASGAYLTAPVLVNRLTLAELKSYDVGRINPESAYAKRFPEQEPIDGTRMPALSSLFKHVKKIESQLLQTMHAAGPSQGAQAPSGGSAPRVAGERGGRFIHFNIETKISPEKHNDTVSPSVFARKLLDVIREHGMQSRVTVQSFDWRTLQIIHSLQKDQGKRVKTSCLTAQQSWTDNITAVPGKKSWLGSVNAAEHADVPEMVKAAGCDIWSPFFADINAHLVKKAQSLGLKVLPWTVNEPQDLEVVIQLGVEGLITDYPDRALPILQRLGKTIQP
jgi:glycerophosphoryl diester phosphodiesterase